MKQRNWCGCCQAAFSSFVCSLTLLSCADPKEKPQVMASELSDAAAIPDSATPKDLATDTAPEALVDRYKLDLSSYQDVVDSGGTGLWAPHQTVVVFPLDLRKPTKSILSPAPADIQKVGTKAPCTPSPDTALLRHLDDSMASAAVPHLDTGRVEQVKLTMPYRMYYGTLMGSNGPICYGYRTTGNQWHWKLGPIVPEANDKWAINIGSITVGADRVDAFAILFHTSMGVRDIEVFVTRH